MPDPLNSFNMRPRGIERSQARPDRRDPPGSVGSRRRLASQAIDLPRDGGVDLGRLFTASRHLLSRHRGLQAPYRLEAPDKHAVRSGGGFGADSLDRRLNDGNLSHHGAPPMVLHRHFPAVRETPDFKGLLRCEKIVAEREGLSESFCHSAGFPEKEASPADYSDTLRTTSRPTFAAPNPPTLKWRRSSKRAISCLAHG